jgi:hypothetical protein
MLLAGLLAVMVLGLGVGAYLRDPPEAVVSRFVAGKTRASLIAAILASEPPAITSLQPLTPPVLERVVSGSRVLRRRAIGAGTSDCEPPSRIHCNCSFTSCADCQRASGSLARQVFSHKGYEGPRRKAYLD